MHGSRFRFQVPVPVSLYRCIAVSLFSSSRLNEVEVELACIYGVIMHEGITLLEYSPNILRGECIITP
jgi:hypothetical protein